MRNTRPWEKHSALSILCALLLCSLLNGCASGILKYDKSETLSVNPEYERKLKVEKLPESVHEVAKPEEPRGEPAHVPKLPQPPKHKAVAKSSKKKKKVKAMTSAREPSIEDSEGFEGRRPKVDPFRIGEKISLSLSYFRVVAGQMDLEVLPLVEVNNEKAYHFRIRVKSNDFFSRFYSVDDMAETYVNFENLLPYNVAVHVKESKQLKEIRFLQDHEKLTADYWEKRVTKENGEQNKKLSWAMLPFSQNVISAVFYMRTFTMRPGKELQFRVAEQGENIVFKGEVLRREELKTDIGTFNALVIKPQIHVGGMFKPMGDILIWVSDDDRKFILRIESEIRIGTIVAKITGLEKGN